MLVYKQLSWLTAGDSLVRENVPDNSPIIRHKFYKYIFLL